MVTCNGIMVTQFFTNNDEVFLAWLQQPALRLTWAAPAPRSALNSALNSAPHSAPGSAPHSAVCGSWRSPAGWRLCWAREASLRPGRQWRGPPCNVQSVAELTRPPCQWGMRGCTEIWVAATSASWEAGQPVPPITLWLRWHDEFPQSSTV